MKAKKVLAAVICLNLCLTMAACGSKDNSSKKESSSSAKTTVAEKDESKEKTDETKSEAEEEKNDIDYNVEKTFWKANIPETLKENEDSASEGDDYSSNKFEALNSSEEVERSVKIQVST